jgi:hypothetical protein
MGWHFVHRKRALLTRVHKITSKAPRRLQNDEKPYPQGELLKTEFGAEIRPATAWVPCRRHKEAANVLRALAVGHVL